MPILGPNSKRNNYRLVGVSVPPQVHNYLTLYSLSKGVAKSTLFHGLINDWIQNSGPMEQELLDALLERICKGWRAKKKRNPRYSFNEFKMLLAKELERKGLTLKQVDIILRGLDKHGKNK